MILKIYVKLKCVPLCLRGPRVNPFTTSKAFPSCQRGAEEQTADHVITSCPIYRHQMGFI